MTIMSFQCFNKGFRNVIMRIYLNMENWNAGMLENWKTGKLEKWNLSLLDLFGQNYFRVILPT